MEVRLIVAYCVIAATAVAALIGTVILLRRRARHQRRMRGHKSEQVARMNRGRA